MKNPINNTNHVTNNIEINIKDFKKRKPEVTSKKIVLTIESEKEIIIKNPILFFIVRLTPPFDYSFNLPITSLRFLSDLTIFSNKDFHQSKGFQKCF